MSEYPRRIFSYCSSCLPEMRLQLNEMIYGKAALENARTKHSSEGTNFHPRVALKLDRLEHLKILGKSGGKIRGPRVVNL